MSHYYKSLFEKFINQDISSEELVTLLDWIDRHEDFRDAEVLEKLWMNLENTLNLDPVQAQRIRSRLKNRIKDGEFRNTRSRVKWWWGAAAAVILGVVSLVGSKLVQNSNMTISADFGEIVVVELPDNSVVNLNANSTLIYPRYWDMQAVRQVELEGEAFFQVSKDTVNHKKFVVRTRDLNIEVLGTEFNVNTRDKSSKVILESGSVKLSTIALSDSIWMQPGEIGHLDGSGVLAKSKIGNSDISRSWKEGSITMKDATLSEILKEYKIVFGENIFISDDVPREQIYTVVFPITDKKKAFAILKNLIDGPTTGNDQ